jgi:crotonobetaine/carnitine-CoA ligase
VFLRALELGRDDVLYTPLPLFHGLASRLGVLPALMAGAHVHVAPKFHASTFWREVTECGATVGHTIFTIPPILKGQAPSEWDRAHRLRAMYNASHDPEFERRFGVTLVEAYGMTETGLTIYSAPSERVPGSCGRVDADWEGCIVDDQGLALPDGEVGEIALRPRLPSIMMRGYLNKPAETLAVFADLWYRTGDYARRDADGRYWFTGRKKERIRRRGENISAWEIERVVSDHPAVRDCAAVAHPARAGEDDIRIVLSLQPDGRLAPAELIAWLQGRLPAFMLPRYVEIVDELPYTATAKVEKFKLVSQGLTPGAWDREAQGGERG